MNTAGQEIFYTDNARNINFRGNAVIDGVCAPSSIECTNSATIGGSIMVAGSQLNVTSTIKNNQLNAYTSLYLNNTSGSPATAENIQIFSGGNAGLNICTQSAHPIKLRTYIDEVGAPTSMQILANATRDVEILAPLNIKSFSTPLIMVFQ